MATTVDAATLRRWVQEAARALGEQREYLTDLDAAIGDADHGVNMDRGFRAAVARVNALATDASPGAILRAVGAAVMSSVGGASGPLWGMAFRRAGQQLGDAPEIAGPALADAFDQIVQAMRQLGKAEVGEKTMLDALAPAAESLRTRIEAGDGLAEAVTAAREAAEAGVQATIPLQARASYLGERSIGHQDPGATSASLIVRTLEAVVAPSTLPWGPSIPTAPQPPPLPTMGPLGCAASPRPCKGEGEA
jgi:phosphoenolpyruvate---glycerone phosphotransferase subunit DhaL